MKSYGIVSLGEHVVQSRTRHHNIYTPAPKSSRPTISNILTISENQRHALNHTLATVAVHATHVGKRWSVGAMTCMVASE